jgi:hypothetical protein
MAPSKCWRVISPPVILQGNRLDGFSYIQSEDSDSGSYSGSDSEPDEGDEDHEPNTELKGKRGCSLKPSVPTTRPKKGIKKV